MSTKLSTKDRKRRRVALDNEDPALVKYQNMIDNFGIKPFKKYCGRDRWCKF